MFGFPNIKLLHNIDFLGCFFPPEAHILPENLIYPLIWKYGGFPQGVLVPMGFEGKVYRTAGIPSSLLSRGLTFINIPRMLVLRGVCGMPPKGMYLAVIPVLWLREQLTEIIQLDKHYFLSPLPVCLIFLE